MTLFRIGTPPEPRIAFDATSVDHARKEAVRRIRSMLMQEAARGELLNLDRHIAIETESGVPLAVVTFAEAYGALD